MVFDARGTRAYPDAPFDICTTSYVASNLLLMVNCSGEYPDQNTYKFE